MLLSRIVSVFFVVCLFHPVYGQGIKDIIEPVKLSVGKADTLFIGDLFYAKNYNLSFTTNDKIDVSYDKKSAELILVPKNSFKGITLLHFSLEGETYVIPVVLQEQQKQTVKHTFKFKPEKAFKKLSVLGRFNNWNREQNPLLEKGNGVYEAEVMLEPGNYLYNFSVDGKDIIDPANKETVPTGFDGFNSVLRIAEKEGTKMYLHILGKKDTTESTTYSFFFEHEKSKRKLTKKEIVVLLDNKQLSDKSISVKGSNILVKLTKEEMTKSQQMRILISQEGKNSNLQTIFFANGHTAGMANTTTSWYDGSIYSIMIDRFNDGDKLNDKPVVHDSLAWQANYEGGDLEGITDKIDDGYFDNLGVNIIWISPVYDNPDSAYRENPKPHRWYSGYHGYWPVDNFKVEEKFGSMKSLKRLVAMAHAHKIKVLLDIVAHHVHIENPIFKEHPNWFGTLDLPDGRKNLRLWDEFRLTTWFEPYMPSFDYTKSDSAINWMVDNTIWWLKESGADGFRHDAVKHVPNSFWRALTRKLNEEIEIPEKRKVYQIGETFGSNELVGSYVNNGQLSAQFDFNLSYSAIPIFLEKERSFVSLDQNLKKTFESFGVHHLMGNIMDSHDKVRFMAYADSDVAKQGIDMRELAWINPPKVDYPSSYRKAELYYAFMFTVPGLPVIYYGSEFGMTGADDPDNRRFMRFDDQLNKYEQHMLARTSLIVNLRKTHSALRYGDFQTIGAGDKTFAYLRCDPTEKLLILLNKDTQRQTVKVKIPTVYTEKTLVDLETGESFKLTKNNCDIFVPAIGWRVLQLK